MKFLKYLLGFLAVLFLLFVIAGFFAPKEYKVERSTLINAPVEQVFPHVQYFEKRNAWYPWMKLDPDMELKTEGNDGTVGAKSVWKGDENVGYGQQTITKIVPNERVDTDLEFFEPFASESKAYVTVAKADGGTNVTWGFGGRHKFFESVLMMMMSMEDMVGKDYENGLAMLKEIVEKEAPMKKNWDVQNVELSGQEFVEIRKKVQMTDISKFYEKNLPSIFEACNKNGLEMSGMPCGLVYAWDEANGMADMSAAIPVKKAKNLGGNMKAVSIPKSKALVVDYYGDYAGTVSAHESIEKYMKSNNISTHSWPVIEQYVTDPTTEPDPNKWLTKVTYRY